MVAPHRHSDIATNAGQRYHRILHPGWENENDQTCADASEIVFIEQAAGPLDAAIEDLEEAIPADTWEFHLSWDRTIRLTNPWTAMLVRETLPDLFGTGPNAAAAVRDLITHMPPRPLDEPEPEPLWDEAGPKVGQVITIAGTSMQTRWTGTHWEPA